MSKIKQLLVLLALPISIGAECPGSDVCGDKGRLFNVRDFGAKGDGATKDTMAIQAAINAAARGGEVRLPAGVYLSGSLFLKSGVDFHLAEGATLKGSPDPADYNAPDVAPQNFGRLGQGDNTSGGHLLCCIEQENVTIRGPGKIDGRRRVHLARGLQAAEARNLRFDDVRLEGESAPRILSQRSVPPLAAAGRTAEDFNNGWVFSKDEVDSTQGRFR